MVIVSQSMQLCLQHYEIFLPAERKCLFMNLFCIEFHLAKVSLGFFFYLDLNLTMHTQSNNTQFMENINETETLEMEADTCKKF